jgi:hypothetical protein
LGLLPSQKNGEQIALNRNLESENGVAWREVDWKFTFEGRSWDEAEISTRYLRMMQELKDELSSGKLYNYEGTRRLVLGLLLENVGLNGLLDLTSIEVLEEAIHRRRALMASSS